MSTLTHLPLEPVCEDYYFLGPNNWRLFAWSWLYLHWLCQNTRNGDMLWWGWDWAFLVSSGYLCSISTILIFINDLFLLASSLISYHPRLGYDFCLYPRNTICQPPSCFIIFPVIQQHLDSGLLCHLLLSLWILSIRRLIRVFLNFRLAFVHLLMPLWVQSSLFLIPELPLLIKLPLCRILMEGLFQSQKCMHILPRFMTFSKMLSK